MYRVPNTKYQIPVSSTKYQLQNINYKVSNTCAKEPWFQVPNTNYKVPNTNNKVPNMNYKVPNTNYKVPNTKCQQPVPRWPGLRSTSPSPSCPLALFQRPWQGKEGQKHYLVIIIQDLICFVYQLDLFFLFCQYYYYYKFSRTQCDYQLRQELQCL